MLWHRIGSAAVAVSNDRLARFAWEQGLRQAPATMLCRYRLRGLLIRMGDTAAVAQLDRDPRTAVVRKIFPFPLSADGGANDVEMVPVEYQACMPAADADPDDAGISAPAAADADGAATSASQKPKKVEEIELDALTWACLCRQTLNQREGVMGLATAVSLVLPHSEECTAASAAFWTSPH